MKKIILSAFVAFLFSANVFAHEAFTLVSSQKKTVEKSDLAALEKAQTVGKKEKSNLTFTADVIQLVVTIGPEDDMLSYRIQGIRNANLIVPPDAKITILFVNTDGDMTHDIRFGHVIAAFAIAPATAGTVGTTRIAHMTEDNETLNAEEIVIKPNEDGAYKYFCSIKGHAKGGMWGNIFVGVKPGDNVKMAEKQTHVHSADEENQEHHHEDKMSGTNMEKPDRKSNDSMSGTNMDDHKSDENSAAAKADDKKSESMAGMNYGEHGAIFNMQPKDGAGEFASTFLLNRIASFRKT